ncbi:tripartite motif-containing protein 2-like [Argopecten irradians]|uniref:tripartite motif-containing protein 2-like n=1 Tax=Argopecten irradians TaxID=31199 RepID=UPI003721AB00
MTAQVPVLGQRTCLNPSHKGKTFEWFCESCADLICVSCISTTHKGHNIVQLSVVTPDNKNKIKQFVSDTEKNDLMEIRKEINSMEDILEKHLSHYKSVELEVEDQGTKLKQDVDTMIAQTLSQLKCSKDENTALIISYKDELEKRLGDIKENLERCKQSLQTGSDIEVFDTMKIIRTGTTLPTRPIMGTAKFTPNLCPSLLTALGEMSLTQPSAASGASPDRPNLLPKAKVLAEWAPTNNIKSICPTIGGGAWSCEMSSETITDWTPTGEVYQLKESLVRITDICVVPKTYALWACSNKDNSVVKLTSGELKWQFSTKSEPLSLCVTKDDQVLVGSKQKITKYTQTGKLVNTTKASLFKKQKVVSPWRLTECQVSKNVAVGDGDWSVDGGKDEPLVLVLDIHLQEVWRYGRSQHATKPGSRPFDPYDVTYDSMGQLIVADYSNRCLHLLSGDGIYLRLLHTDTFRPQALCVDTKGVIWAGFGEDTTSTKNVKLLQYTRD